MEFLLKKGLSPQDKEDLSGWNIFHILVSVNNHKGMKYLMDKLSREEVLTLLSQGSKSNLNTVRCPAFTLLAPEIQRLSTAFALSNQAIASYSCQTHMRFHVIGT